MNLVQSFLKFWTRAKIPSDTMFEQRNLIGLCIAIMLTGTAMLAVISTQLIFPPDDIRIKAPWIALAMLIALAWLNWYGKSRLAAWLLIASLWTLITFSLCNTGGIRMPALSAYLVMILLAGLIFDMSGVIIIGWLSILATAGMALAEITGRITYSEDLLPTPVTLTEDIVLLLICMLLVYAYLKILRSRLRSLAESKFWSDVLFDESPVALWEEDYTDLRSHLIGRKDRDAPYTLRALPSDPEALRSLSNLIHAKRNNRAARDLLSSSNGHDSLLGHLTGESLARQANALTKILHGQQQSEIEIQIQGAGTSPRHLRLTQCVLNEIPDQFYVITAGIDITERVEYASRLKAADERLRAAEHGAKIGIWDWNPVSGDLFWSDEIYRLFGYTPGETEPSYPLFLDHLAPESRTHVEQAVSAALEEDKPYDLECRIIDTHGNSLHAHAYGVVNRDRQGQPIRMLGFFHDISKRKALEVDLRRELQRNRLILQSSMDGFILADDQGNIINVNPAYCNMIGYDRETLLKMNIIDLEASLTPEQVGQKIAGMHKSGGARFQTRHKRSDGGEIELDVSIFIMETDGEPPLFSAFVRDISAQSQLIKERTNLLLTTRQLTRQLLSLQEEERRTIARTLHDEFGQMLTAINAHAQSIQTSATNTLKGDIAQSAQSIQEISKEMIGSIRSALRRLRPGSISEFGLKGAIRELAEELCGITSLPIQIDIDDIVDTLDPDAQIQIFRICQEALTNITRHAAAKKAIIQVVSTPARIQLSIRDDGKGFDSTQTTNLGLGLVGIRERAESIGATCHIDSAPGSGTIINIDMPHGA